MSFDPLECKSNYSATSNDMNLVHWPLMGGLLQLVNWYSMQEEQGRAAAHSGPSLLYQM